MKTTSLRFASLTAALLIAGPAPAAELVTEFLGRGATTTREFEVKAPWILDWRVNSEYRSSMKVEIHLIESPSGVYQGLILQTRRAGNGVKLFNQGGRYRLRISATLADWQLKVEELTRDEAALYTPRQ